MSLAVLAVALGVLSMLSLGIGLVPSTTVTRYHAEVFALWRRHLKQR